MFEELLTGGLGLIGSLINGAAQRKRQAQMMAHLREVEAWQRSNLASGIGAIQGAKQAYMADPNRAKVASEWQKLMENPSSLTDAAVSSTKQNALSSSAANYAEGSRRLKQNAQKAGLGGSGYLATLDSGLFQQASRDENNLAANIDTQAAKTRFDDKSKVLSGYQNWTDQDLSTQYGFSKDIASLLGGIQYGNSLAMTG